MYDFHAFSQERNQKLKSRASQLDKQINVLISDSVALLKARMSELGIHANNTVDLLAKAKEIVGRHKELQSKASKLQAQVTFYLMQIYFLSTNILTRFLKYIIILFFQS